MLVDIGSSKVYVPDGKSYVIGPWKILNEILYK